MPQRVEREFPPQLILQLGQSLRMVHAVRRWCGFGKVDPEATVKAVAKAYNISLWQSDPYTREIHEQVGLSIMRCRGPYAAGCGDRLALSISVPQKMPFAFAVARQLGHFFLHTDKTRDGEVRFHYEEAKRLDDQSKLFAYALIAPASTIFEKTGQRPPSDSYLLCALTRPKMGRSFVPA